MPSTINALALEFDPSRFYPSPIITDKLTVDHDRLLNGSILSTPINAPLPVAEEIIYSVSFPTPEKRTVLRPDAEPFSPSMWKAEPKTETKAELETELIQLEWRQQDVTSNHIPQAYNSYVTNSSSPFSQPIQPVQPIQPIHPTQQSQPYPQHPQPYPQPPQPQQFHPALASPFHLPPKPRRTRTRSPKSRSPKSRSESQKYHDYPQQIPKMQPTGPILTAQQQTAQWIFNQRLAASQPFQPTQPTQPTQQIQQTQQAQFSGMGVGRYHGHNDNYGYGYIDPFWNQLPSGMMQQVPQQQDTRGRWSCDQKCDNEWYLRAQPGLEKNASPGVSPEASPKTKDCRDRRVRIEDPAVWLVESGRCRWCRVGRCASEKMCEKVIWREKVMEQRWMEQRWMEQRWMEQKWMEQKWMEGMMAGGMEQRWMGGIVGQRERPMERL
ncbi:Protein of unknown function [Pyronema omphalodes CBS 100304]|uniref:Uncharacterized protein n=1 Tax=Pyronema omphalodes (strain CBS 100304) TaxID=1076935 RepID=U4LRV5_PYROM|nr:Protein of unknown function [Pyronema omphalodes CBS 100304]